MPWTFNRENHRILQAEWNNPMHRLQPHQAKPLRIWLWWYSGHQWEVKPSLWTEGIVCWTVSGGAWQQTKGIQRWVSLGRPSVQEGCREDGKGPTKVPTTHILCREAEGAGSDNIGKAETTKVFNNCLQLFEGQFFGHHHQKPLGSVRQHNKENNHTKLFQRLKLDSWKNIFASSTGISCQTGWEILSMERFVQTMQWLIWPFVATAIFQGVESWINGGLELIIP